MKRLLSIAILLVAQPAAAQSFTWSGFSGEAAKGAKASLLPDGPWLTGSLARATTVSIQDTTPPRPRILEHAEGLTLQIYIDPAALASFTAAATTLAPTEAAARATIGPTSAGMMLRPGIKLDEHAPVASGLSKVRIGWTWDGGSLEIRGFVPTDKISTAYEARYVAMPEMNPNVTLPGDFTLLDAPGGAVFVTSTNTGRVAAMTLDKKDKHTLVRIGQGAVGWLPTSKIKPIPTSLEEGEEGGVVGGVEGGVAGYDLRDPQATLQPGTRVFASIDGPAVGEVGAFFRLKPSKVVKSWARFTVKTRFGIVEVWGRPGDASPPPPPTPVNVPPTQLEQSRVSGDRNIVPDDKTKVEIARAGKEKIVGSFKLCLDAAGAITTVNLLKSTGFPRYDDTLRAGIRTWKYKPYEVNGKPAPVCTAVTFVYSTVPATP